LGLDDYILRRRREREERRELLTAIKPEMETEPKNKPTQLHKIEEEPVLELQKALDEMNLQQTQEEGN
jgi:hypothetical protein